MNTAGGRRGGGAATSLVQFSPTFLVGSIPDNALLEFSKRKNEGCKHLVDVVGASRSVACGQDLCDVLRQQAGDRRVVTNEAQNVVPQTHEHSPSIELSSSPTVEVKPGPRGGFDLVCTEVVSA